jgi:surface polysaccharide O-acyltransferase-like enzyme
MVFWLTVLAIIGFGRRFLEFTNKFTVYLAKSSFGVYIFHQSWIVVVAYFVFLATDSPWLQMPLIYVIALALTYLTYELSRRIPLTRWMFGFKR